MLSLKGLAFATPVRRATLALSIGVGASLVIGSIAVVIAYFSAQGTGDKSITDLKTVAYRIYLAIFLLAAAATHAYTLYHFRKAVEKPTFEPLASRLKFCIGLAVVFLVLNAIPHTAQRDATEWVPAEDKVSKEVSVGWPLGVITYREYFSKETKTQFGAFALLVDVLIFGFGCANILAYDGSSREEKVETEPLVIEKKKKPGEKDPEAPPDEFDYRNAIRKDAKESDPETLSLD
jgi:hypothetical protein